MPDQPGAVHLIGGGRDEDAIALLLAPFVADCAAAVGGADGVFVGGGLTPAYHAAFGATRALLRASVSAGVPYAGFSAGAAIASERAVIGGYLIDGTVVCDENAGEELEEITVVDGLGLVPFSIDVHAAQWGTVSRLVAAAAAGLIESGFAIDEHTTVCWRGGSDTTDAAVGGVGAAWQVSRSDSPAHSGALVTRRTA